MTLQEGTQELRKKCSGRSGFPASLRLAVFAFVLAVAAPWQTGCVTGAGGRQTISPVILAITEGIVCTGATMDWNGRPQDRPALILAEQALSSLLNKTNATPADVNTALGSLPNLETLPWLEPVLGLFADTRAQELIRVLRDGLRCATRGDLAAREPGDPKPNRVIVYRSTGKQWLWRVIDGRGRIQPGGGAGYSWKANCKRAAIRENPGLHVTVFE